MMWQYLSAVKIPFLNLILDDTVCGSVVVDFLFIVTPTVGVCNCSMFRCALLYVHSSIAIILMGYRDLSSWCHVMVEWLFLAVPWGCLRFVIVVFPDHTHLLFLKCHILSKMTISLLYLSISAVIFDYYSKMNMGKS